MKPDGIFSYVKRIFVYSEKKKEISILENVYSSSLEALNGQTKLATKGMYNGSFQPISSLPFL